MRMRKLRGPHKKQSMPFENFRTHDPAGQPRRPRGALRRGAEVTPEALKEKGLAKRSHPVKILAAARSRRSSTSAPCLQRRRPEKIEAAGGSCHTLEP
jgi:large subunit ribosomal protein L15